MVNKTKWSLSSWSTNPSWRGSSRQIVADTYKLGKCGNVATGMFKGALRSVTWWADEIVQVGSDKCSLRKCLACIETCKDTKWEEMEFSQRTGKESLGLQCSEEREEQKMMRR